MLIASAIAASISAAVNISLFSHKKSKTQIVGEALLAGIAGFLAIPVATLAALVAAEGALGLVIAALALGLYSTAYEFVQQVIFQGEIDPTKLLVAFVMGTFGSYLSVYLGDLTDEVNVIVVFLIPYTTGVSSGFMGEAIDAWRNFIRFIEEKPTRFYL